MNRFCALLLLTSFAAGAETSSVTREFLEKSYFQGLDLKPGEPPQLILRLKTNGARFYCIRNGKEEKVSDSGDVIAIKVGEKFSFNEQHSSLEFRPLPPPLDKNGWIIDSYFDARSFGGGEATRYGVALIAGKADALELRFIEPERNFDPKLPPTDPTFQKLQTILAATDPLSRHDLTAETESGEAKPPFPASVSALHFRWEKKGGASPDPLEVRWIAENVRGAEKNHLIATTKSDPNKREGEFSLTKPSTGFPPGQYRVEIWQSGKMIYSEKFEIKGE